MYAHIFNIFGLNLRQIDITSVLWHLNNSFTEFFSVFYLKSRRPEDLMKRLVKQRDTALPSCLKENLTSAIWLLTRFSRLAFVTKTVQLFLSIPRTFNLAPETVCFSRNARRVIILLHVRWKTKAPLYHWKMNVTREQSVVQRLTFTFILCTKTDHRTSHVALMLNNNLQSIVILISQYVLK